MTTSDAVAERRLPPDDKRRLSVGDVLVSSSSTSVMATAHLSDSRSVPEKPEDEDEAADAANAAADDDPTEDADDNEDELLLATATHTNRSLSNSKRRPFVLHIMPFWLNSCNVINIKKEIKFKK